VGWSVVEWSVVKCSKGLSNGLSNIIRRYVDNMNFDAYMALSFITSFLILLVPFYKHYTYYCMFRMLLINFVNYVILFLCLCILLVIYVPFWVFSFIVLFCVLFLCKCLLYFYHRVSPHLQLTNISEYSLWSAPIARSRAPSPGGRTRLSGALRSL